MIKIALVFPYKGFFDIAFNTFEEHNKFEQDYKSENTLYTEYQLEEIEAIDNKVDKSKLKDIDVIISRGITAELIKAQVDIPVVEIPVVGNDLVRSLHEAKKSTGKRRLL